MGAKSNTNNEINQKVSVVADKYDILVVKNTISKYYRCGFLESDVSLKVSFEVLNIPARPRCFLFLYPQLSGDI